ncbi:ATP-dependent nuclease [Fodinicurvata sediminis]|uniref:ATP-dependent nuclease n=1 Tax=Fodinicurvata sediminis TaxID=1121832 RepID=UPI00040BCC1C|nr:AAA family ATPase [Fodinicurvata sediminis]
MQLINEVEVSYFRSFYKFRIQKLKDLNIIFGKNDSGKSNLVRALNLFFSGSPDYTQPFEFPVDFCEQRLNDAEESDDIRKFLYVKVTFNTPTSYKKSLGESFYVKRQWTVSRGQDFHEEYSSNVHSNKKHIAARFLNNIRFIYIPAIKDNKIFEMLLSEIHETLANTEQFERAISDFSDSLQGLTNQMFDNLPKDVSSNTKIGAPTRLSQLFQTLDFETISDRENTTKSLTRQRGDGIKVRHIPELLNFISEESSYYYHIWGFEEPENSLDFVASQSEALRLLDLAKGSGVQVLMTTHSPSFYLLDDPKVAKFYVRKDEQGLSIAIQGKELEKFDVEQAIGEGFYLPAAARALEDVARTESRAKEAEAEVAQLKEELSTITKPIVLTEGRTDAKLLNIAWEKLYGGDPPFSIRSCETGGENAGSGNGGANHLATRLKGIASDHPHTVIGLFDYDDEGTRAYKLDRNFVEIQIGSFLVKRGLHGQSYAACLPAPSFRQECKEYQNLPIEFLFRDDHLEREVSGKKLALKLKKASIQVGGNKIEKSLENVTHFKDVGEGKVDFAETIAPTFESEAFDGFERVFSLIERIIDYARNSRANP